MKADAESTRVVLSKKSARAWVPLVRRWGADTLRGGSERRSFSGELFLLGLIWLCLAATGLAQVRLDLSARGSADDLGFAEKVAPILYRHCVECHRDGGQGPFSLVTYAEAKKHARLISEVVSAGTMPPWKPDPVAGPPIKDARGLSTSEKTVLQRWVEQGAPPGDLTQTPRAPAFASGWTLGKPDLILELSEAYLLPAEGKDIYRNFVIPIPVSGVRFVRALEFNPESRLVIHHATMLFDESQSARAMDQAEPGPGFGGMEFGDASNPGGHFVGWSPGQVPYQAYPGTAWKVQSGTDLVLQLHLLPSGKPEFVRPRVALYFDDQPPTRTTTVVQLSEQKIEISAGDANHVIEERFVLPVSASVLGLYPHAHYLAKDFWVYAELPGGGQRSLIRIPDWDFNWQRDYRFAEPVTFPTGTTLVMRTRFDNSAGNPRNPSRPPKTVLGGWNSTDEMSEVAIQLLLSSPNDLAAVQRAQVLYAMSAAGGVAPYSFQLGVRWLKMGRTEDAFRAFTLALQKDPAYADAHQRLAGMEEDAGNHEKALAHARAAHAAAPAEPTHALNLARLLALRGAHDEARKVLRASLVRNPRHATLLLEAGVSAAKAGDWAGAGDALTAASRSDERGVRIEAWRMLALVALAQADEPRAIAALSALLAEPVLNTDEIEALTAGLPAPHGWLALAKSTAVNPRADRVENVWKSLRERLRASGRADWLQALEALSASPQREGGKAR